MAVLTINCHSDGLVVCMQKQLYEDSQILILKNLFRLRFLFPVQCKSLLMAVICILFAHEREAVLTT